MCTIEQDRNVVLLGDIRGGCHEDLMDGVPLDIQAKNVERPIVSFLRICGQLHATCLATTTGLHLCLDNNGAAEFLGCCLRMSWSANNDATGGGDPMASEKLLGLELVQVHCHVLTVR
jgi:hypothetical protein